MRLRPRLACAAAAAALLAASGAAAAPTCLDAAGATIKCGARGALPVGAAPPAEAPTAELAPPGDGSAGVWAPLSLVAAIFALIALMPEFDGSRAEDWAPGESDD